MNPIPPAGRSKPDPDNPYRYVCPDCGSQVHRGNRSRQYHCQACETWYAFDELQDKKVDD